MRSGLASNSNLRYFAIEAHFKPVIRAKHNHARVQGRGFEAGTFESLLDIPTVALAAVRHHLLGQSLSKSISSQWDIMTRIVPPSRSNALAGSGSIMPYLVWIQGGMTVGATHIPRAFSDRDLATGVWCCVRRQGR